MEGPTLETERLVLRPLRREDVGERYVSWMNDAGVTQYLESRFRTCGEDDLRQYVADVNARAGVLFLGIFVREGMLYIGNIKLEINTYHARGEVGIIIGDRTVWGRGYAAEAIGALATHAFGDPGLYKLTAGCYENNIGSLRAFEKAGFVVEGVLKRHYRFGDQRVDRIVLARFAGDTG